MQPYIRSSSLVIILRNYIAVFICLFTFFIVCLYLKIDGNSYNLLLPKLKSKANSITFEPDTLNHKNNEIRDKSYQKSESQSKSSNTVEEDYTNHFITNRVDLSTCSKNQGFTQLIDSSITGQIVLENEGDGVNFDVVIDGQSFQYYQLCFATHVDHQHSFRISLDTIDNYNSTSKVSKQSVMDCDMYLSASVLNPSPVSWDWRSADKGLVDSIQLSSYAKEFRESNLNSLFIGVTGKFPQVIHHCRLNVKILKISTEELLHRLSPLLRGGQIMLPRDLENLKKSKYQFST